MAIMHARMGPAPGLGWVVKGWDPLLMTSKAVTILL
jgi:hypothetical protein